MAKENKPTPWTIFRFLIENDVPLIDKNGEEIPYPPWKSASPLLMSQVFEGPYGKLCLASSSNMTDSDPIPLHGHFLQKQDGGLKKGENSVVQSSFMMGNESCNKGHLHLNYIGSLPLVTDQLWSKIVETSHKIQPDFLNKKMTSGLKSKVTLVIFIQASCRSCTENMGLFENIKKTASYIEGSSVYVMNCSSDPVTCNSNKVRGFPTLSIFRGIEWLRFSEYFTTHSAKLKFTTKVDYHGVLLLKPIMSWFSSIAQTAVSYVKQDSLDHSVMVKDVNLFGTVMPRDSPYLPYAPRSSTYFYPLECFVLACEQLYGQAGCYIQQNQEVQASVFDNEHGDLVIIQVDLKRRDGVEVKIMQLGQPLLKTMSADSEHAIHQFHKQHRYKIGKNQKCEGYFGVCTDFLVNFTIDHGRLPVSKISTASFHTNNRMLMFDELPVLVSFIYKDNITDNSKFYQSLMKIAKDFYNEIAVVTVDVEEYPAWAGQFVPLGYSTKFAGTTDNAWLYHYPRFCLVDWNDHHHAAFYPLPDGVPDPDDFEVHRVINFIRDFLADPGAMMVETEHF